MSETYCPICKKNNCGALHDEDGNTMRMVLITSKSGDDFLRSRGFEVNNNEITRWDDYCHAERKFNHATLNGEFSARELSAIAEWMWANQGKQRTKLLDEITAESQAMGLYDDHNKEPTP